VDMSQVRTPLEARQAAEEAVHGWHAKLKVEHPKLDLEEKAELCKRIEREHRWPNPMSDEEAVEQGSVFRLPIRCLYHATGYEACRSQERGWVNEIKAGRKANPWAPFNAGLVAVEGLKSRNEFSLKSALRGEYRCKVFGHQHCFQGTLECHEEDPLEEAFKRFESKIYIGLTPDMVRFLGEMQNTYDQLQKGRSNTDLMKGLRSTLSEKFGVLYTTYRKALISEFVQADSKGGVEIPAHYKAGGIVQTMAKYESESGFELPDLEEFPKGFVYTEEVETDGEVTQVSRVLDADIDAHLERVLSWWPMMSHLSQGVMTNVKEQAFSKHSVYGPNQINAYFMHWTVALLRQQTWDLCVQIMDAYARFELKGMKNPETSKSKKRKSEADTESGPAKKKGNKATSNRQVIFLLVLQNVFLLTNILHFYIFELC
jgi:hypothetical protein